MWTKLKRDKLLAEGRWLLGAFRGEVEPPYFGSQARESSAQCRDGKKNCLETSSDCNSGLIDQFRFVHAKVESYTYVQPHASHTHNLGSL
jgi:hypothetical protein